MSVGERRVGLLGLGLMGSAISVRLLEAGWEVHGFDPLADARQAHEDRGGVVHDSAAAVARKCRLMLLSLPNGQVTRAACLEADGVREGAAAGAVVIDTTTTAPEEAVSVGTELAGDSITFLDVGLSGSSPMVQRGGGLAMVGGPLEQCPEAQEVLEAICRRVVQVGGPGDGMRAKLVVNHVLAINRVATAEALVFAERMGMDAGRMLNVLRSSAAHSTAMDIWGARMVDGEYEEPTSRVRQHIKDAVHILELGRAHQAPMLLMAQVGHLGQMAAANGLGDLDNSCIAEVVRMLAGTGRLAPERHDSDESPPAAGTPRERNPSSSA